MDRLLVTMINMESGTDGVRKMVVKRVQQRERERERERVTE